MIRITIYSYSTVSLESFLYIIIFLFYFKIYKKKQLLVDDDYSLLLLSITSSYYFIYYLLFIVKRCFSVKFFLNCDFNIIIVIILITHVRHTHQYIQTLHIRMTLVLVFGDIMKVFQPNTKSQ